MSNASLKLSEMPKNRTNPFLETGVEEIRENIHRRFVNSSGPDRKAVISCVDGETAEVLQTRFVRQMEVDEEQFTKIYKKYLTLFFDLTKAGQRVLYYIQNCMRINNDMVLIDIDECAKFCKYTGRSTVYRGLTELCNAGIIARAYKECLFYINPMVMFNGSRVTFINEYIRATEKKCLADQEKRLIAEQKQIEEHLLSIEDNNQ